MEDMDNGGKIPMKRKKNIKQNSLEKCLNLLRRLWHLTKNGVVLCVIIYWIIHTK